MSINDSELKLSKPDLAVIIPCFNEAATIVETANQVDRVLTSQIDQFAGLRVEYIQLLEELRSNDEIADCTLISVNGITLWQESKKEFLDLSIKQMDAFWKYKTKVLDQVILNYEKKFLILIKINDKLVLSTLIRANTPIGLATLLVEEYANKIQKVSEDMLFF